VIGPRHRAGHGGYGVGVVAGIHRCEEGPLEVFGGRQEAPESAGEGLEDVGSVVPVVERHLVLLEIPGEFEPHAAMQRESALPAAQLVAGPLEAIQEDAQIGAEGHAALQGGQGTQGRNGCARDSVGLASGGGNRHGVAVGDHGLEEGVAIDPVRVAQVDEADRGRSHGRAVSRRGEPRFVPRLPEATDVVDELPSGLPDSSDVLARESLREIRGVKNAVPQVGGSCLYRRTGRLQTRPAPSSSGYRR
jgi:hypothetical protein